MLLSGMMIIIKSWRENMWHDRKALKRALTAVMCMQAAQTVVVGCYPQ